MGSLIIILLTSIFWPLIIIVAVIYQICCIIFPTIAKILGKLINILPAIKIEKEEEKDK